MPFIDSNLYIWLILPLMVFFARVIDVSLGTLRIIFISRGKRNVAPILGFIEVFIWITIVSQIVSHAHNLLAYLAYAAGFATGSYLGMYIENRLAFGVQLIQAIVQDHAEELVDNLHTAGYGVTCVDGMGANGVVKIIYTVVFRRNLTQVLAIIHRTHPRAFLSIEDLRSTQAGIFPFPLHTQATFLFGRKFK
ncbi:MAG: DUF2179 domain-containing protein [Acidobacteriaceae bacterium]